MVSITQTTTYETKVLICFHNNFNTNFQVVALASRFAKLHYNNGFQAYFFYSCYQYYRLNVRCLKKHIFPISSILAISNIYISSLTFINILPNMFSPTPSTVPHSLSFQEDPCSRYASPVSINLFAKSAF